MDIISILNRLQILRMRKGKVIILWRGHRRARRESRIDQKIGFRIQQRRCRAEENDESARLPRLRYC